MTCRITESAGSAGQPGQTEWLATGGAAMTVNPYSGNMWWREAKRHHLTGRREAEKPNGDLGIALNHLNRAVELYRQVGDLETASIALEDAGHVRGLLWEGT
jgi:hypothetical protein